MKTCIIIAGATGDIGIEYVRACLSKKNIDVIALSQKRVLDMHNEKLIAMRLDLTDSHSIREAFGHIDLSKYDSILFLHTIGVDRYDPRGYPHIRKMSTIDPDVYDTNVNTFKYLLRYLTLTIKGINTKSERLVKFKAALIGGVPDKFAIFVIEDFCEAKNISRQYIRSMVDLYPNWASGLVINVSSTITRSALKVRPHANVTYWLTPLEVANRSVDELLQAGAGYKEINIFKESPGFKEGYYEDSQALYDKWSRETGIS